MGALSLMKVTKDMQIHNTTTGELMFTTQINLKLPTEEK
jgi:hypothetical protein